MKESKEKSALVATCNSHREAEQAVKELQKAGFNMKKLSLIGKDYHSEEQVVGYYTWPLVPWREKRRQAAQGATLRIRFPWSCSDGWRSTRASRAKASAARCCASRLRIASVSESI